MLLSPATWLPGLDPWLVVAMSITSLLSEGLYGATTFGPAITFNVGWQICYLLGLADGTLSQVTLHLTIMETASALLQCVLLRRQIDVRLALVQAMPLCSLAAIGQVFMFRLDGPWLKRSLAAVLLVMVVQRIWAHQQRPPPRDRPPPAGLDLRRPRVLGSVVLWSGAAGLMGGVTSIAGPPLMMLFSIHEADIDLGAWRGASALVRLLLNLSRGAVFVAAGRVHPARSWPLDASMVVAGWAGLLAGNRLSRSFRDAGALHWWLVVYLLYAVGMMAVAGSGRAVQRKATLALGAAAAIALTGLGTHAVCRRRRESDDSEQRDGKLLAEAFLEGVPPPVRQVGADDERAAVPVE